MLSSDSVPLQPPAQIETDKPPTAWYRLFGRNSTNGMQKILSPGNSLPRDVALDDPEHDTSNLLATLIAEDALQATLAWQDERKINDEDGESGSECSWNHHLVEQTRTDQLQIQNSTLQEQVQELRVELRSEASRSQLLVNEVDDLRSANSKLVAQVEQFESERVVREEEMQQLQKRNTVLEKLLQASARAVHIDKDKTPSTAETRSQSSEMETPAIGEGLMMMHRVDDNAFKDRKELDTGGSNSQKKSRKRGRREKEADEYAEKFVPSAKRFKRDMTVEELVWAQG